jgi:hypothetical protein
MFLCTPGLQAGHELGAEIHSGSEAHQAAVTQAVQQPLGLRRGCAAFGKSIKRSTNNRQHVRELKMRRVLIIAFGFGLLAGTQPAMADQIRQACVNTALQQCNARGGQCTPSPQYLSLYNQCVTRETAKAAAAAKAKQEKAKLTAAARNNANPGGFGTKAQRSK